MPVTKAAAAHALSVRNQSRACFYFNSHSTPWKPKKVGAVSVSQPTTIFLEKYKCEPVYITQQICKYEYCHQPVELVPIPPCPAGGTAGPGCKHVFLRGERSCCGLCMWRTPNKEF
ncbi:unnamed protein product [Allacma fusca]|uniref:Uncharacterized protein n=1 Tax=Allacma fusca TaxID=39272 RepID=A0A8J2LSJ8_9HEXA|nr:unnamed protein product [Allacma fusca]